MADITHGTWIKDGKAVDSVYQGGAKVYGRNLAAGTSEPFVMLYGIPHTAWNAGKKRAEISLPVTVKAWEVLPYKTFRCAVTPGITYMQSIYVSTDAPLTGTAVQVTWFDLSSGHDVAGKTDMLSISENVYRITSTYMWPDNSGNSNVFRAFDIYNFARVFDLSKGTFLYFYQPKLELGTVATPYSLAPEDVLK
ncbi:hypothetical protein [Lactiplantibacillus pentosus]|uniref:hypothetical protein n=1 Tax=Lactiplantibacillus pentosus TaxID=1589 RepID=UPI00376F66A3